MSTDASRPPEVGTAMPEWTTVVDPAAMRVFSLVTDDPNPIHWDREVVRRSGLGDRLVNQGGLNVAYIANAIEAWLGATAQITALKVRFLGNVYEEETVVAGGHVASVDGAGSGLPNLELSVWLRRADGSDVLVGTARVSLSERKTA